MLICVVREVAPGDFQYVPVTEVPELKSDDTLYVGAFRTQQENLGPYGSHTRTICLPIGKLQAFKPCEQPTAERCCGSTSVKVGGERAVRVCGH